MDYDWQDFKARHGGVEGARAAFERACESLLRQMHPGVNVQAVRANPGDEGIDIYVGDIGQEPITVYQCKFHLEAIGKSQKSQIRESFRTAVNSEKYNLKKWILCIPKVLDVDENKWWGGFKHEQEDVEKIEMDLLNGDQLLGEAKRHGLIGVWFNVNKEGSAELKRISESIAQVPEVLERLSDRLGKPQPLGQHIPPTIGKVFVDSDNRLALLSEHFLDSNGSRRASVPPVALIANGGEGKSRAAIEFAHRCGDVYATQLMVSASSPSILRQQIAGLSRVSSLSIQTALLDENDQVSAVRAQLPQLAAFGMLIVFDGADDDDTAILIKEMSQQLGAAHIIITTRFRKWGRSIVTKEMPNLPPEEAHRYLLESRPAGGTLSNEEENAIHELALILGYLPLALESAGAYLRVEGGSYSQYLDIIQNHPEKPLKWKDSLELEYPDAVWNAYQVTWDRIKEKNSHAYAILTMSSMLALAPIPAGLWPQSLDVGDHGTKEFQDYAANWDLKDCLRILRDYSQIQPLEGQAAYALHPVIRSILRASIPEDEFLHLLASPLSMLGQALAGDVEHPEMWERWEYLRAHVEVVLEDAEQARIGHPTTSLLCLLGNYYVARGAYDKAEPVLRRAVEIDEFAWGASASEWYFLFEQPDVHRIFPRHLADLARLLRETGRIEEAQHLLQRAITGVSTQHPEAPILGRLKHDLGTVFACAEETKNAEQLFREALRIDEANRDNPELDIDQDVARDLHSLGRVLVEQGRHDEAEEILCRALRIDRRWRNRSPRKRTVGTVASAFDGPRNLDESWSSKPTEEQKFVFTLPRWLGGHYGRYTPETARDLCAIAHLRVAQSRPAEAKRLFDAALGIYWYTWGPLHPETEATWKYRSRIEPLIRCGDVEGTYGGWVLGLMVAELKELKGRATP